MPQNSLGLVLLISFGVESREQSSSPYTVTNSLGGLEDITGILCPSLSLLLQFFPWNGKDTDPVKLVLPLFSNKIVYDCIRWYKLHDCYTEHANITWTQGLIVIIAPLLIPKVVQSCVWQERPIRAGVWWAACQNWKTPCINIRPFPPGAETKRSWVLARQAQYHRSNSAACSGTVLPGGHGTNSCHPPQEILSAESPSCTSAGPVKVIPVTAVKPDPFSLMKSLVAILRPGNNRL